MHGASLCPPPDFLACCFVRVQQHLPDLCHETGTAQAPSVQCQPAESSPLPGRKDEKERKRIKEFIIEYDRSLKSKRSDELPALILSAILTVQAAGEWLTYKIIANEINKDRELPALRIFFSQLSSPLLWILLAAIGISIFLGKKMDAFIICLIVVLNYALGFFQEYRAEKSILALRKAAPQLSRVLRDNIEQKIESRYLVPGHTDLRFERTLLQTGPGGRGPVYSF